MKGVKEMNQLKVFTIFDDRGKKEFERIFGEQNIVFFQKSNVIGIRYNYGSDKLKNIMPLVPFSVTQQFMITPEHFINIYLNLKKMGKRAFIHMTDELPEDEESEFHTLLNSLKEGNKSEILDRLNHLEEEYNVIPKSISFTHQKNRISLNSNGIIFGDDEAYEITDELLYN